MAAYVIGFNRIHDPDLYAQYLEAGAPTLTGLEGVRGLVFSDVCDPLDGEAPSLHGLTSPVSKAEVDTSYVCVVDRWGNAFSATPGDTMSGITAR